MDGAARSIQGDANTGESFRGRGYRTYVLMTLTLVYTLNFVDRILISVVGRPIIDEFGLSSFQFGLLTGFGFALFYSVLGIPIARLSERYDRVRIISVCIVLWSVATVLCGLTAGFVSLLIARMLVGVGEAGCTPPANSILSDYYKAADRPVALGVYAAGVPIGIVLAQLLGGAILDVFSWREAFIFVGLPGVALGLVVFFTIQEPPRGYSNDPQTPLAKMGGLKDAIAELASKKTFWFLAVGSSVSTFAGFALVSFHSLYIQYTYDVSAADAAIRYMSIISFGAVLGAMGSGFAVQRLAPHTIRAPFIVPSVGCLLAAPLMVLAILVTNNIAMIILFFLGVMFQNAFTGPMYLIAQSVVSIRLRATSIAIILLIINIVGYGLGPPFIGLLADAFTGAKIEALGLSDLLGVDCSPSDASLTGELAGACYEAKAYGMKYALIINAFLFIAAAGVLLYGSRFYRDDKVSVPDGAAA